MRAAREWWKSFFTGPWRELHSRVFSPEETRADVELLLRKLRFSPPARFLDVPCGCGRIAIELARRGYEMAGVDVSKKLLDVARQEARRAGVDVDLRCCDMRLLRWRGQFDGAFSIGGTFGYFDDPGNLEFLRGVRRALRKGGRFVMEAMVAESILPRFQKRSQAKIGDIVIFQASRYDAQNSRVNTSWTFVKGGHAIKRRSSTRLYTCRELRKLLERAGFSNVRVMAWPSGKAFSVGAPRAYISAERP